MITLHDLSLRWHELRQHPGFRRNPSKVLGRAVAWAMHCLFGVSARARFRRWDFRLYLPARWRGGGSTSPYLFREDYEPELVLLERFLEPGMTFIDGGANTGVFTFAAARMVGEHGRVMAFEPGQDCFAALKRSRRLNGFHHVALHNQALSDKCSTARLFHHHNQANSFSLGGDTASQVAFEEVETTTLDRIVAAEDPPSVDLIKLDVEGAEELVLRGGREVLTRFRPTIIFEINPEACERLELAVDGVPTLLRRLGYRFCAIADEGRLTPAASFREFGNYVAIHETCTLT
jgi:FkbM family methyltransferase